MSTSPAKLAANQTNAQHSTGPRTEQGKAATSQNATKSGLFSTRDFVLPDEQQVWNDLDESLRAELRPAGTVEEALTAEIRSALWRLRRCGEIESQTLPDEAAQQSIDRARAQFNRLLHRSLAELRTLQTQPQLRLEYFDGRLSQTAPGLCDWRAVYKGLIDKSRVIVHEGTVERRREDNVLDRYLIPGAPPPFTNKPKRRRRQSRATRNAPAVPASNTSAAVATMLLPYFRKRHKKRRDSLLDSQGERAYNPG